jgi:hypothetical protein
MEAASAFRITTNIPPLPLSLNSPYQRVASFVGLVIFSSASVVANSPDVIASFRDEVEPLFDNYCYDCHGFGIKEGGVTLDEFTPETIDDHELWMRILKNTRAHIMPPLEEAHPSIEERQQLAQWIKTELFGLDPANPDPGTLTVQRLNRIEYQNTIKDLTGVDFDAADTFPKDNSGEGFDNIGDVLTLSPMMLEKYFDAAIEIIGQAVPTQPLVMPELTLSGKSLVKQFSAPTIADDASDQNLQLSFYEPSERSATIPIKFAGEYQLAVTIKPQSFTSFAGFDYSKCRFVMKVDGEVKVDQEFEYSSRKVPDFTFNYDWPVGEHTISFAVEPISVDPEKIKRLKMRIEAVSLRGPADLSHWVQPKNYARFFPSEVPTEPAARHHYTVKVLRDFADRAFRRPVDQTTLDHLVRIAEDVMSHEDFSYETGVAQAMVAVLASPRFIFREESIDPSSAHDRFPLIDEFSLASRLSYFLWSSMPDAELFQLAEQGQLRANLETQFQRMLADPRSDNFMKNFAGQWLHSRDIGSVNINSIEVWLRDNPDPSVFAAQKAYQVVREIPEFQRTPEEQETYTRTRATMRTLYDMKRPQLKTKELGAMQKETEMFFEHIIRQDRPLREMLDSDYTFLNATLADIYGIEGVKGNDMRLVQLPEDSPRGGILTQGTILAVTSNPTRTSPVKRGVFILENILGTPPAAPPPNIPALEDAASPEEIALMSLRETLALHRENPLCSSCHNRMDPLGLALDNFNAMGMWRDSELGQPIDPAGQLVTGEKFASVQELKHILATTRIRDFYTCFSEKILIYALGRGLEYYDTETIDQMVDTLVAHDGAPSALFQALINSAPFQKTRPANAQSALAHASVPAL